MIIVLECERNEKILCYTAALYLFHRIVRMHQFIISNARFTPTSIQQRIDGDGQAVDQYEPHRGS
jgi:hypothetical protein